MDASVTNSINTASPINYCRSKGFSDANIVVDVILTDSTLKVSQENFTNGTALGMGLRGL